MWAGVMPRPPARTSNPLRAEPWRGSGTRQRPLAAPQPARSRPELYEVMCSSSGPQPPAPLQTHPCADTKPARLPIPVPAVGGGSFPAGLWPRRKRGGHEGPGQRTGHVQGHSTWRGGFGGRPPLPFIPLLLGPHCPFLSASGSGIRAGQGLLRDPGEGPFISQSRGVAREGCAL